MIRLSPLLTIASLLIASLAGPQAALAQATPSPPVDPASEEPGDITVLPKVKTLVEAVYPPNALNDRVFAEVSLQIDIGADGLVESTSVVSTTVLREDGSPITGKNNYEFAEAATIAVTQIEFHPAQAGDTPVPVRIGYTYKFQLPALAPVALAAPAPEGTQTTTLPATPAQVNLSGFLLERGSRTPLAGVTVLVYRGEGDDAVGFEAETNAKGRFEFYGLAAANWKIKIAPSGYRIYKTSETIRKGEGVDATYYVEKKSYNPYDVTVQGEREKKEVTRRTLSAAEIVSVPGTLGDPVQAVENLPGVARPSFGSDQLSVRGSGIGDTGVFVSGAAIPLMYHFGGLKSVMPARVIDSIDFYPGNYSVEYGRAMGGILDLNLKRLAPERTHGTVDISALDASIYVETPIGDKAAIAFSGRRSYIDAVLGAVLPDDADFSFKTAPRYYDYQLMGNYRPTDKHEFRAMFFGSDDRLKLVFDDPAELSAGVQSGSLAAVTQFQRILLEHRYVPSADFKNELKLSLGRDQVKFSLFDSFKFDFDVQTVQLRDTARLAVSEKLTLRAGVDTSMSYVSGSVLAGRPADEGEPQEEFDASSVIYTEFNNRPILFAAPFIEASLKLGEAEIVPGLRMDYWGATNKFSVDPRIAARYNLSD
ncbi:MAG: TonB-dependent receptor plug domain-containing protein [Kofleriaceae bacterium]|nr:TonB-dependent receptor plug domain-containing protein [Kofleriaceae bacterium]